MRAVVARLAELPGARHLGLLLKLGVSFGLIALVVRQIDPKALADCLARQSTIWIVATVMVSLLQIALLTLRWQQILRALGSQSGLGSALAVTFMGCFFGAFLFGPTGSDVARAVLAPTRSLGRSGIVHSVLFERLASVIGLGLAAAPLVLLDALPLSYRMPLIAALAVVVVAIVLGIGLSQVAHGLVARVKALSAALHELELSWRRLIRVWPRFAAAIVIAAAGQLLVAVEAWCLARSQHLGVPFVDFAILMPTVMLLVALPISAGGWGVREGAIVGALALVGVETAPALVLSVELGLIWTLVALPGGVIWLHRWFCTPRPPGPDARGMA
jgi:glycosyltransferase 2 family protein